MVAVGLRVSEVLPFTGILFVGWLVLGSTLRDVGHHGDSWVYLSYMDSSGPYRIIAAQTSRPALPWAWALGYAMAGAEAWSYHLIAAALSAWAAVCLYWIVLQTLPGARLAAFLAAVLAILWPADPTRYDIATLGNRQALFLFMLGLALLVRGIRSQSRSNLVASSAAFACSLLTYEAHALVVLLVGGAAAAYGKTRRKRLQLAATAWVPLLILGAAVALSIWFAPNHRMYQVRLLELSPAQFASQVSTGVVVLLVEAWSLPVDLLRAGAVPNLAWVQLNSGVVVLWALAVGLRHDRTTRLDAVITLRIATFAVVAVIASLGVFAISAIPLSQPDRTQTFALTWAALLTVALVATAASLVARRWAVPSWLGTLLFVLLCAPLIYVFFAMTAVYQRNYRQAWSEQSSILRDITRAAPDIADGSLVVISGLPDTRIVLQSGYTCEFALGYLDGHPTLAPGFSNFITDPVEIVSQRINCGLLFNGRDLDNRVHLEFRQTGVYDRFLPYEYEFPYNRVLLFEYSENGSTRLLEGIPDGLAPPGARVGDYNPRALILDQARRSGTLRALD